MKSEFIQVGDIGIQFLLQAADTNGAVAMFEFAVPVGARMPLPHKHERYDETIYGVEGVVTFIVEGKTVEIADAQFNVSGSYTGVRTKFHPPVRRRTTAPTSPTAHRNATRSRSPSIRNDGVSRSIGTP
jgi:hypothetical protein